MVIGTRQPTAAAYEGAWHRLCELYDDKYMLTQSVLTTLTNLPTLEKPSYIGIRKLVDTVHEDVRQLTTLEVPVEHWDQILVHMMLTRLDEQTKHAWEMQRDNEMPTLALMTAFLDKKAQSLAHLQGESNERSSFKRKFDNNSSASRQPKQIKLERKEPTSQAWARRNCYCCKADHPLWKCPEFLSLNLAEQQDASCLKGEITEEKYNADCD